MLKINSPFVWLCCAFAALGACLYGYDGVYFNGVSTLDVFVKHFGERQSDGTYALPASALSYMTAMINVGELVGSLTAAPLNEKIGRKGVFLVGSAAIIIGVVLQLVSSSSRALITAGRAVLGYGVGNFSATSPLYMGEIAPPALRSQLLMCWQLTISISQIIAAGINRGMVDIDSSFAYRFPIGFQLAFPALILLFYWFVPESPRWLIRKGRHDRAIKAVQVLHREDKAYDHNTEVRVMQNDVDRERSEEAESSWLQLVTDPVERRKVVFSAGALIAQQINGIQ